MHVNKKRLLFQNDYLNELIETWRENKSRKARRTVQIIFVLGMYQVRNRKRLIASHKTLAVQNWLDNIVQNESDDILDSEKVALEKVKLVWRYLTKKEMKLARMYE